MAFAHTDANLDGKNPALLSVWRHDGSAWSKVPAPNGVNTAERYVYAENITEFSVFAPMWSASGLPKANFTAEPIDGDALLAVQFTDTSRNAESWSWTFGDGATFGPATVDAGARTVTADITHFSTYALFTKEGVLPTARATPAPQTPPAGETTETISFLYVAIALVAVLIVAGAAFVLMDRKR